MCDQFFLKGFVENLNTQKLFFLEDALMTLYETI